MKQIPANRNDATTGHKLQGMSKDAIIVLSWPTGSLAAMFKKLGVCRPISCLNTIQTVPYKTNRHGQIIPAISPTNIIHGQNTKVQERHAGKTPASNNNNILLIRL